MTVDELLRLLKNVKQTGDRQWKANCPSHEDEEPSLSVAEGNDGRVLLHCFGGCPTQAVCKALGIQESDLFPENDFLPSTGQTTKKAKPEDKEQRAASLRRLHRATVDDDGTISAYLCHRGLSGEVPNDVRLHPALPYYDDENEHIGDYPAMIATVRDPAGQAVTVHKTYLAAGGEGKAEVPKPKKLHPPIERGATRGAAIRLADPVDGVLALAEGIETALAVMEATGTPAWATISAGGMKAIELPDEVQRVEIWGDNDSSGTGQRAAAALASRLCKENREVYVLLPDHEGTDWLDVLVSDGPKALAEARTQVGKWEPSPDDNTAAEEQKRESQIAAAQELISGFLEQAAAGEKDASAVFDQEIIGALAALPAAECAKAKAQIKRQFGRDLSLHDLQRAIKERRQQDRYLHAAKPGERPILPKVTSTLQDPPGPKEAVIPLNWLISADEGIVRLIEKEDGFRTEQVSPVPVLLTGLLLDVDSKDEHAQIAWWRRNGWREEIVQRSRIANSRELVTLAGKGLPVTSNTAAELVQFLAEYYGGLHPVSAGTWTARPSFGGIGC